MTYEELIAFRDTVSLPKLLELFDNTHIPDGACYIDHISVQYLDGRSCGHETLYEASGFQFVDGKVQQYQYEEVDSDLNSFAEAHKDCVFVSDGKIRVSDELNELDLTTTIRNINVCGKLFPEFVNLPVFNMQFDPIGYFKLEYLWNNRKDVLYPGIHDFKIDGFMGTWKATDHKAIFGNIYYLMECETWGVELPGLILDASGKVMLEEVMYGFDEEAIQELQDIILTDKLYADVVQQLMDKQNDTAYGETQAWVYLDNGRSIEVTLEQDMLPPDEHFYSVRLHCNEKEADAGEFHGTCGIIDQLNSKTDSMEEVKGLIYSSLLCNDHYAVEECYLMDPPGEALKDSHESLDSMIQSASSRISAQMDRIDEGKMPGR